jgi:hypothetical protein
LWPVFSNNFSLPDIEPSQLNAVILSQKPAIAPRLGEPHRKTHQETHDGID